MVDKVVARSPQLEAATYITLGMLPLLAARSPLLGKDMDDVAQMSIRGTTRYVVHCSKQPLVWAIKALLVFLSLNVFGFAFNSNFSVALPKHLCFLDPNGDGILTAPEIETVVAKVSVRAVSAMLSICACRFVLAVKKPPPGFEPEQAAGGVGLEGFWKGVASRSGPVVLADLATTLLVLVATFLEVVTCLGLDARAVFTFGGIGGIAFGLAAQSLVGNIISGVLIMITQPFQVGDWVNASSAEGHVKAIKWSYTEVETEEGPLVRVPNSTMVEVETCNRSVSSTRQLVVKVPVKFPKGTFADVKKLLAGLEDRMASLDIIGERLRHRPEALFHGIGTFDGTDYASEVHLEVVLDNGGLGNAHDISSRLNIEVIGYLLEQDCEVPGLYAD